MHRRNHSKLSAKHAAIPMCLCRKEESPPVMTDGVICYSAPQMLKRSLVCKILMSSSCDAVGLISINCPSR